MIATGDIDLMWCDYCAGVIKKTARQCRFCQQPRFSSEQRAFPEHTCNVAYIINALASWLPQCASLISRLPDSSLKYLLLQASAKHKACGLSYFESGFPRYISGDSNEVPAEPPDLRLISLVVDVLTMLAQEKVDISELLNHKKLKFLGLSAEAIAGELSQSNFELNIEPAYFETCCWCAERTGCGEFCRVCLTSPEGLPYDIACAVEKVSGRKVRTMEDLFFLSPVENQALKEIDLCQFASKIKPAPEFVLYLPQFDELFLCQISGLLGADDGGSFTELPQSTYRRMASEHGLTVCADLVGDSRDFLMLARHCRYRRRYEEALVVLRLALTMLAKSKAHEVVGARMLLLKELDSWDVSTGLVEEARALVELERSRLVVTSEAEHWCFCQSCTGMIAADAHGCRFCRMPSVNKQANLWLEQAYREKLAHTIKYCASWTPHFYYLIARLPQSPLKTILDEAITNCQNHSLVNVDTASSDNSDEIEDILGESLEVPGCQPGLQVTALIVEILIALTRNGADLSLGLNHAKMRFLNITAQGLKEEIARRATTLAATQRVHCHWCSSLIIQEEIPCRYCGAYDSGFADEVTLAPAFLRRFPVFDVEYLRSIVLYSAVQKGIHDSSWRSQFTVSLAANDISLEVVEQEIARVKSQNNYRFPSSTYRRQATEAGLIVKDRNFDVIKELISLAVQCRRRKRLEDWLLVIKFTLMLFSADFSLPGFRAAQILILDELKEAPGHLEEVQELRREQSENFSKFLDDNTTEEPRQRS